MTKIHDSEENVQQNKVQVNSLHTSGAQSINEESRTLDDDYCLSLADAEGDEDEEDEDEEEGDDDSGDDDNGDNEDNGSADESDIDMFGKSEDDAEDESKVRDTQSNNVNGETTKPYQTASTYTIIPTMASPQSTSIHCMATSKCMRWVLTGGQDGYVRKIDLISSMTGKVNLTIAQKQSLVDSILYAGVLISYWDYSSINAKTPPAIHSLAMHSDALWSLSGLDNGQIKLQTLRFDEGFTLHSFDHHDRPVSCIALANDEFSFLSGSWDKKAALCDLNTGNVVRTFDSLSGQISSLKFKPPRCEENNMFLCSTIDGQSTVWDSRDASCVAKIPPSQGVPPWCMNSCWSLDGNYVYCGRRNALVEEFDVRAGFSVSRNIKLPSGSGSVSALAAMPNGRHIVCASHDNVRLWDLQSTYGVPFLIVSGHHGGTVSSVQVDEEARFMLTTGGSRGWEGTSTGLLIGYDISIPDKPV